MNKNPVNFFIVLALLCMPFINGCQNNLSDEGLSYIASDTLGTLLLDSQRDSIPIYSNNLIKYINTSVSANMLVGKYSNFESKSLLRFKSVSAGYDTMNVLSAKLYLRYNKVFFKDSVGVTSFNIYRLLKSYDYTTVTYDNFLNSDIGSTVLGTYTGTPADTSLIGITLDNQTIKDWLKYATDTNYSVKNYGLVLLANSNSTTIKSFYSPNSSTFIPYVTAVLQEPTTGKIDTVSLNPTAEFVSLNNVPDINSIPGRIIVQNGIAIKDVLKFDISKLPGKVIINQAVFEFKIDWANTFYTQGVDTRLTLRMLTDTTTLADDGIAYYSFQTDSNTFSVYFTAMAQKWNYGQAVNLGLLMKNIYEYSNLDKYVFYGFDYPDVSKRPKFKIRYSIKR